MVGVLQEKQAGQEAGVLLLAGPSQHVADILLVEVHADETVLVLLMWGSCREFLLYLSTFAVLVVLLATVVSDAF